MKFIMKHKLAVFLLTILIAGVSAGFIFSKTINFDETTAIYGNRLDGIKEVNVTNEQIKQVEESLKQSAEKVKVRVAGKVIYITIHTANGTDQAAAKALGEKSIEGFTPEQKSFFDIQILIDNEENKTQYPILGYKHRLKDKITWTKDR